MQIAIIMATPPGFNPGMLFSELMAKSFFKRHNIYEKVRYYRFIPMYKRLGLTCNAECHQMIMRCDVGINFTALTRVSEIEGCVPLYWGDFLHMHQYVRGMSRFMGEGEEGRRLADEILLCHGAPLDMVRRVVTFGTTLLFNSASDLLDQSYGPFLQKFLRNVRRVLVRDAMSAAQVVALTGGEWPSPLGLDVTQLVTLIEDWRQVFDYDVEFSLEPFGGLVFLARAQHDLPSVRRLIERLSDMLSLQFRWLHWGGVSSFPWLRPVHAELGIHEGNTSGIEKLSALINAISQARVVVTDTYHLAVISWALGTPAVMLSGDYWPVERDVNAGFILSRLDKRQVFFAQHGLLEFLIKPNTVANSSELISALEKITSYVVDGHIGIWHRSLVRERAMWCESQLIEALMVSGESTNRLS